MINLTFDTLNNFIFDFDGVILNSLDVKTNAFYKMYEPYGLKIAKSVKDYHINNG